MERKYGLFLHPWKKNKKLCLEQNNYKCVKCGATKKENYNMELDVHHIIPFRCFKNYKDAHNIKNLIALCKKYHFIEESKKSIRETTIGNDCKVWNYVNIYEAEIGRHTNIASFVEIQNGVKIGNDCVIQSHTFIAGNTTIGNNVFIGPGTMICNCKEPRAHNDNWICSPVIIEDNVSIGAGCVILPGVKIGKGSMLGAGAVITKNVGNNEVVVGNPAKVIR